MSFDAWEASIRPSSDSLMHWGIPGMKHGRRRYQNEDGTWTRAGLEARRKREGFGERRKERKAAKRLKKAERIEERTKRRVARAEAKRQSNVKYWTDDELQKKIERLKMEQEYRDLKQNPAIKTGKELVNKYLDFKEGQEKRTAELNRQKVELARLEVQKIQAKNAVSKAQKEASKAKYEADKAKAETKTAKEKRRSGQKYLNKKDYLGAKKAYKQAKRNHWKTGNGNSNNKS